MEAHYSHEVLAMKLLHRGLSIELAEDDARIPVMEVLLFGRTLPPPLPLPVMPDSLPPVAPAPSAPALVVPERVVEWWLKLHPVERKELIMLAKAPMSPAAVEAALHVSQREVMGMHSRINRYAVRLRVDVAVRAKGRARKGRRYFLPPRAVPWILALEQHGGALFVAR